MLTQEKATGTYQVYRMYRYQVFIVTGAGCVAHAKYLPLSRTTDFFWIRHNLLTKYSSGGDIMFCRKLLLAVPGIIDNSRTKAVGVRCQEAP